jgi:hypothetical protein
MLLAGQLAAGTRLYATSLKAADFETGVVASSFVWQ